MVPAADTPATRAPSPPAPPPHAGEGSRDGVLSPLPLAGEGRERAAPKARRVAKERARALRSSQTDAERKLWYHLRAHRFLGMKFKRQHPIGSYIADFACLEHRLVIELDGGQHAENATYDESRTRYMEAQGLRVLRFWNDEVLVQTEAVLDRIRLAAGDGSE